MAWTRIKELDAFDTGPGVDPGDSPIFWYQDVIALMAQPDFEKLIQKNAYFRGEPACVLVGKVDAGNDEDAIAVISCPPIRIPYDEKFKL